MAYLILFSKGRETGRRQLTGPLTIGRAPDCDLAVRDVLLSRHHCRVEPAGAGWVVVDLGSKNGTWLDGQPVGRRGFRYGEEIRAGKTIFRLMAGDLPADEPVGAGGTGSAYGPGAANAANAAASGRGASGRPADPFEALSGTVAGAVFDTLDFESAGGRPTRPRRPVNRFPTPRPMPPDPASYAQDDLYSMLSEIASSSWDSIYANASRPTRPAPRVVMPDGVEVAAGVAAGGATGTATAPPPRRPQSAAISHDPRTAARRSRSRRAQVDFSLQAPAERPARPARPASPLVPPVEARPVERPVAVARRTWQAVVRILGRVRRAVSPRGAVVLF